MTTIPANQDVELLRDFVNTLEISPGSPDREELVSGADVGSWFRARGVSLDDPNADGQTQVRGFREALRSILEANNGHERDPEAQARINRVAAHARLRMVVDDQGQPRLRPAASGVAGALGHLCAAMVRTAETGEWPRLKACRDGDCRWAFYDSSKNGSKAWCSMQSCGSRAKMRAYRARQRQTTSA